MTAGDPAEPGVKPQPLYRPNPADDYRNAAGRRNFFELEVMLWRCHRDPGADINDLLCDTADRITAAMLALGWQPPHPPATLTLIHTEPSNRDGTVIR